MTAQRNNKYTFNDRDIESMSHDELLEAAKALIEFVSWGDNRVYNEKKKLRSMYGIKQSGEEPELLPDRRNDFRVGIHAN